MFLRILKVYLGVHIVVNGESTKFIIIDYKITSFRVKGLMVLVII